MKWNLKLTFLILFIFLLFGTNYKQTNKIEELYSIVAALENELDAYKEKIEFLEERIQEIEEKLCLYP